ncbi:MAG TPA: hypothetical protein PLW73_10460 [Methanoregulaceae archaeon]|nr:hypothetical protein [Methanoregulaceae archaeon]
MVSIANFEKVVGLKLYTPVAMNDNALAGKHYAPFDTVGMFMLGRRTTARPQFIQDGTVG